MSTLLLASDILVSYPEQNIFELDPPIFNIPPNATNWELELSHDTSEFRAAALAQGIKQKYNPLCSFFGVNPFIIPPSDEHSQSVDLPFKNYVTPPPLPESQIPSPISFIERINPRGNTRMYKVKIGADIRLLKLFLDKDVDDESDIEQVRLPMRLFHQEKKAYAHLLHYGICDKGIVPRCFGWFTLSGKDIDTLSVFAESSMDYYLFAHLKGHRIRHPPKCLLLEYFADAVNLSIGNITTDIAERALRSIHEVHSAYVEHGDIHRRNILLLADGRVVWVDFDNSVTVGSDGENQPKLTRQQLLYECALVWSLLYIGLLPDRRIGLQHWVY